MIIWKKKHKKFAYLTSRVSDPTVGEGEKGTGRVCMRQMDTETLNSGTVKCQPPRSSNAGSSLLEFRRIFRRSVNFPEARSWMHGDRGGIIFQTLPDHMLPLIVVWQWMLRFIWYVGFTCSCSFLNWTPIWQSLLLNLHIQETQHDLR